MFGRKKTFLVALSTSLFLLLAGCSNGSSEIGKNSINIAEAGPSAFSGEIRLTGILEAENSVALTAQLSGTVSSVNASEGQKVQKGETIISLDKNELLVQLDQARANLEKSKAAADQAKIAYDDIEKEFQRSQKLFKEGVIAPKELEMVTSKRDQARLQYDSAQKAGLAAAQDSVKMIELNLAKTDIKSPFSGILVSRNLTAGENVSPGTPVASVVSIDSLILTANIPDTLVNYLQTGQKTEVTCNSLPGKTFSGEIIFISPVSLASGQSFPVKIRVNNPDWLLKAGMPASSILHYKENAPLVVPNSALLKQGSKTFVYVVQEGKAVKTPVVTGLANDTHTIILGGLQAGELIVIEGTDTVTEGDVIKAQ